MTKLVPVGAIERRIYQLRRQRVMLDSDLAELYGVTTSNLNKAVSRNSDRFPIDFMFQVTADEWESLKFQTGIANEVSSGEGTVSKGRGGRRSLPYVFTEHGSVMLSNVLHSERAVLVSVAIVRAFVRLRSVLAINGDLAKRVETLEQQIRDHVGSVDQRFEAVITAIQALMVEDESPEPEPEPDPPSKEYGFRPGDTGAV